MEDINFSFHPHTNRFDWYEREFLRMCYKMNSLVSEERALRAGGPPARARAPSGPAPGPTRPRRGRGRGAAGRAAAEAEE